MLGYNKYRSKRILKKELSDLRKDLRREVYKKEPNIFELENIQYQIELIKDAMFQYYSFIPKRAKYE